MLQDDRLLLTLRGVRCLLEFFQRGLRVGAGFAQGNRAFLFIFFCLGKAITWEISHTQPVVAGSRAARASVGVHQSAGFPFGCFGLQLEFANRGVDLGCHVAAVDGFMFARIVAGFFGFLEMALVLHLDVLGHPVKATWRVLGLHHGGISLDAQRIARLVHVNAMLFVVIALVFLKFDGRVSQPAFARFLGAFACFFGVFQAIVVNVFQRLDHQHGVHLRQAGQGLTLAYVVVGEGLELHCAAIGLGAGQGDAGLVGADYRLDGHARHRAARLGANHSGSPEGIAAVFPHDLRQLVVDDGGFFLAHQPGGLQLAFLQR